MSVRTSIQRHKSQPGVSAHAYRERRLAAFRAGLGRRKAVYLDVNYWIELQKAAAGQPSRDEYDALLHLLRAGVASGQIMCPPSATLAMEFGKQSDPATRAATGRLVDELCCGAGLLADDDLVAAEVARLLVSGLAPGCLSPDRMWVWTPVGCMVASTTPPDLPFPQTPQKRNHYAKAHFDVLMEVTLEEALAFEQPDTPSPWAALASTLNDGNAEHAHEVTSFEQLLASEARGAAEASADMIAAAVQVLRRDLGLPKDVDLAPTQWIKLVGVALGKSATAKAGVPSLYIRAGLHALLRWNRRQKFKPNDVFDFSHAAGALGYCDLFLTEGPLKDMLGRGPLKLAGATDCKVIALPTDAVRAVASLTAPKS